MASLAALRDATRRLLGIGDVLAAWLAPWLTLVIQLSIAQAFLVSQVTGLMLGGRAAEPLSGTWWSHVAHQVVASGPGVAVQTACPLLLLAGLLTRPAAAAMLLQFVLLPPVMMTSGIGALWLALFVWLLVSGPGTFSLDHLLATGVSVSPVPGSRIVAKAYAWVSTQLTPKYLLLLRVLVGATVLPMGGAAIVPAHPLPMEAMLASSQLTVLAACTVAGAGVRAAAVALMVSLPFATGPLTERLSWLLVLAILAVHGGGAVSLDGLLRRWSRLRQARGFVDAPHVVVVGGGFGGIAAARGLASAPCRITLVDQCNHHVFQPLLYQVATAGLSPAEIATPIRFLLRDKANVRVLLAEVTGVDPETKAVLLDRGRLDYDYLVLATGARHGYFGHDEWSRFAPGLKSIEDATDIRRRLLLAFENAESTDNMVERAAWLTFVVVGGGPTGIELAGAISELARNGMQGEFRSIDPAQARVLLVQSGPRLLPTFPPSLSEAAAVSLRGLGVEILLNRKVDEVRAEAAVIDGEALPARTILWAAGVMASPAARWLGTVPDRVGRIPVQANLSVAGHPDIFVVGDTAASNGWNGGPVPGLAPAAKQGGRYVADVIRAGLTGRTLPPPFRYRHFGSLATIGRAAAVADFEYLRFKGALAWWIWGVAHIVFLVGGRSRITVMIEWLWAYLTFKRSTRLITGTQAANPSLTGKMEAFVAGRS